MSAKNELVQLAEHISGNAKNPFYDAPTVILVFAKRENLTPVEDSCLAIENIFLAADSLGIGTCWIYAVKAIFTHPDGLAFQKQLGLSGAYQIVGSLAVGYPAGEHPKAKERKEEFYQIV